MKDIFKHMSEDSDRRPAAVSGYERLRLRLDWVEGMERTLLDLYLNHNASYSRLAELTGFSERYVARKLQRLLKCLQSEEYISIMRHQRLFDPTTLEVAYDRYLLGMSVRSISKKRNLSRYMVGKKIRCLEEWLNKKDKG
jgi:DNA-binding transcriptional regulator LsrR (DeoR family)